MMDFESFVIAARCASEAQLREARDWLLDCGWPVVYTRSRFGTFRRVNVSYAGGLAQFLSDTRELADSDAS